MLKAKLLKRTVTDLYRYKSTCGYIVGICRHQHSVVQTSPSLRISRSLNTTFRGIYLRNNLSTDTSKNNDDEVMKEKSKELLNAVESKQSDKNGLKLSTEKILFLPKANDIDTSKVKKSTESITQTSPGSPSTKESNTEIQTSKEENVNYKEFPDTVSPSIGIQKASNKHNRLLNEALFDPGRMVLNPNSFRNSRVQYRNNIIATPLIEVRAKKHSVTKNPSPIKLSSIKAKKKLMEDEPIKVEKSTEPNKSKELLISPSISELKPNTWKVSKPDKITELVKDDLKSISRNVSASTASKAWERIQNRRKKTGKSSGVRARVEQERNSGLVLKNTNVGEQIINERLRDILQELDACNIRKYLKEEESIINKRKKEVPLLVSKDKDVIDAEEKIKTDLTGSRQGISTQKKDAWLSSKRNVIPESKRKKLVSPKQSESEEATGQYQKELNATYEQPKESSSHTGTVTWELPSSHYTVSSRYATQSELLLKQRQYDNYKKFVSDFKKLLGINCPKSKLGRDTNNASFSAVAQRSVLQKAEPRSDYSLAPGQQWPASNPFHQQASFMPMGIPFGPPPINGVSPIDSVYQVSSYYAKSPKDQLQAQGFHFQNQGVQTGQLDASRPQLPQHNIENRPTFPQGNIGYVNPEVHHCDQYYKGPVKRCLTSAEVLEIISDQKSPPLQPGQSFPIHQNYQMNVGPMSGFPGAAVFSHPPQQPISPAFGPIPMNMVQNPLQMNMLPTPENPDQPIAGFPVQNTLATFPVQTPSQALPDFQVQEDHIHPIEGQLGIPTQSQPGFTIQGPPAFPLHGPPAFPIQGPPAFPIQGPPAIPIQGPPAFPIQGPPVIPTQVQPEFPIQPRFPVQTPPLFSKHVMFDPSAQAMPGYSEPKTPVCLKTTIMGDQRQPDQGFPQQTTPDSSDQNTRHPNTGFPGWLPGFIGNASPSTGMPNLARQSDPGITIQSDPNVTSQPMPGLPEPIKAIYSELSTPGLPKQTTFSGQMMPSQSGITVPGSQPELGYMQQSIPGYSVQTQPSFSEVTTFDIPRHPYQVFTQQTVPSYSRQMPKSSTMPGISAKTVPSSVRHTIPSLPEETSPSFPGRTLNNFDIASKSKKELPLPRDVVSVFGCS